MKTKTIVLISASVLLLGGGIFFLFRKKKKDNTEEENEKQAENAEPIPFFQINEVMKNDAGYAYAVDYTFQDVRDTFRPFDNPYSVEPYSSKKSSYSLQLSTNENENDAGYGMVSFDLYKDGQFVKNLYKTT